MRYTLLKLEGLQALHLGTKSETHDFSGSLLHSDTLSAALAATKAQGGVSSEEVLKFISSFAVSTAFPYIGEYYFFPKPLGELPVAMSKQEEQLHRKALKKVQFVEFSIWRRMINGEEIHLDRDVQYEGAYLLPASLTNFTPPFKKQINQRVTVSRDNHNETTPFFFEWIYFAPNAGLFFLAEAESSEVLKEVVRCTELLGYSGIGTDKNVGGGQFTISQEELEFDAPKQTSEQLLLSSYLPSKEELDQIDLTQSRYKLEQRTGFIAGSNQHQLRHLRRKGIYLLEVGSLLKTKQLLKGKVVNLRPAWEDAALHPVYRSGKPISIPIKLFQHG